MRQLRDGDVDRALAAYHGHDRITVADSYDEALDTIVGRWAAARAEGEDAVMLASRNQDVASLNRCARAVVAAAGRLDGPELSVRGLNYQRGDEIMTLRNNGRLGVRNGTRGVIDSVDLDQRTMTVTFSTGERATLPPDYLDAGFLTHAYASTVHKAQGMTCDRAFLLATDDLYQELGYVALSRGRLGNHSSQSAGSSTTWKAHRTRPPSNATALTYFSPGSRPVGRNSSRSTSIGPLTSRRCPPPNSSTSAGGSPR